MFFPDPILQNILFPDFQNINEQYNINKQQKELCTPNAYIHRNINSAAEIRILQVTCRNCILKKIDCILKNNGS